MNPNSLPSGSGESNDVRGGESRKAMTDKQLVRFATQFRKGMLGKESSHRRCAMVSWPLASLLSVDGVKCRTVEGDLGFCNHVWIELEDGRVLDPTMDQFNIDDGLGKDWPPVYLGPPTFLHPKPGARTFNPCPQGEAAK